MRRNMLLVFMLFVGMTTMGAAAYFAQLPILHGVQQRSSSLTVCPKYVIDYGTVMSVPTGCVSSTGAIVPCCVDSGGKAYAVNEQLLPDSISIDSSGRTVNHFTVCSGMQVQWHTNVGVCP